MQLNCLPGAEKDKSCGCKQKLGTVLCQDSPFHLETPIQLYRYKYFDLLRVPHNKYRDFHDKCLNNFIKNLQVKLYSVKTLIQLKESPH